MHDVDIVWSEFDRNLAANGGKVCRVYSPVSSIRIGHVNIVVNPHKHNGDNFPRYLSFCHWNNIYILRPDDYGYAFIFVKASVYTFKIPSAEIRQMLLSPIKLATNVFLGSL